MAAGIGLAFLIETVFNRRVSRPIEIQARLQLPLLLSIPYIRRKERGGVLLSPDHGQRLVGNPHDRTVSAVDPTPDGKKLPTISSHHFILPYSETIRDRILFNFEVNNVTHKPKLVAVTGLSSGAGSSTIAAGLATAFSEIPGKKVLLVDLNACHADVSMQIGEIPGRSLNEALRLAKHTKFRETPQNLYHASACVQRDARGLSEFSPVHLHDLMPHLQTSEYDYIIFDMPPVNQTSCTLSMARMMDKVLLVLDGENTTRDGLVWGYGELVKGKADVSCVFNKNRTLAPDWLIGGN